MQKSSETFSKTPSLQWTQDRVKNFWNYQSRYPENYFTSLYGHEIAKVVCKHVPRSSRILDYACGTGSLIGHLLRSGFIVGGCDLSSESVKHAQRSYAGYAGFCGASTIDEMLEGEARFDAAVLVELVEHIEDQTLAKVMMNLRRLLKPNGLVIITTPNEEKLAANMVFCPSCNHTFHRWQHIRSWDAQALAVRLHTEKFKFVASCETDFSLSRKNGVARYFLRRLLGILLRQKKPHLIVVAKNNCETKC